LLQHRLVLAALLVGGGQREAEEGQTRLTRSHPKMQGLVERVGAGYCPVLDVAAILEAHRAAIFRRLARRRHAQASYRLA
jgi:hypothetical protein